MARVVGEMVHLPVSATLPSEYQPGQTSGAQLFHPTQMLSESFKGFPGGAVVKSPPANAGDTGSSPGPGRSHMPRSN